MNHDSQEELKNLTSMQPGPPVMAAGKVSFVMYIFYNNCVNWPRSKVNDLIECVDDAISITRKTFLKHTNKESRKDIELSLGYSAHWKQGMTASADWGITYLRSKLNGVRVYIFVHSAIEYVFAPAQSTR